MTFPNQRDLDHRIELVEDAKSPAHRINRMAPEHETELKGQHDNYLAEGQMEQTYSAFGTGTHFFNKKEWSSTSLY